MIILINGPCGVGKTQVSSELVWMFDRAVMLDGDYIGAVHPFAIYDDQRIDYLYRTIRHLVAFHIEQGAYPNFVVNYVFEIPELLAKLRGSLGELDDDTYAFRLTCAEQELVRRIVEQGSALLQAHLAFRDALRASPNLRKEYKGLKAGPAGRHKQDRAAYSESKTSFVQRVAQVWLAANGV